MADNKKLYLFLFFFLGAICPTFVINGIMHKEIVYIILGIIGGCISYFCYCCYKKKCK